jgi:hypothetical protein
MFFVLKVSEIVAVSVISKAVPSRPHCEDTQQKKMLKERGDKKMIVRVYAGMQAHGGF